jgi:hypothetical protein
MKNRNLQILQIFCFFTNFQDFQLKLWDLYLPKGTIVMADFFTTYTTFQALQGRIPFGRFGDMSVFLWETPWNRPITKHISSEKKIGTLEIQFDRRLKHFSIRSITEMKKENITAVKTQPDNINNAYMSFSTSYLLILAFQH